MLNVNEIAIPPREKLPNTGKHWFQGVPLTRRQHQCVYYLLSGLPNKQLAYEMGCSQGTVKVYLSRIFERLDVHDRVELVVKYYQQRTAELEQHITELETQLPKEPAEQLAA